MEMKCADSLELDVHKVAYSPDGVEGFYWPVADAERACFGDNIIESYPNILAELCAPDDEKAPYSLLFKYFLAEAVAMFWASLVINRCRSLGLTLSYPDRLRYIPHLSRGEAPPLYCLDVLRRRSNNAKKLSRRLTFNRLRRILSLLKFGSSGVRVGPLKVKPLTRSVLKNDVVATQRSPLIYRQANVEAKDVVFCRSDRWFSPVSDDELAKFSQLGLVEFEKKIIDIVEALYSEHGLKLDAPCRDYFHSLLSQGSACFRAHLARLGSLPDEELPNNVWTGSGGNVWDCMLRFAVMRKGGVATGHDHGAGLAHVDNAMISLIEFWACDRFVTFSEGQRDELRSRQDTWPSFASGYKTEIHSPSDGKVKEIRHFSHMSATSPPIRTIMVPPPIYDGDRGRNGPYSSDIVYADWQAQLISRLSGWGYKVILKVHPECRVLPPRQFVEQFGANIDLRPFDQVMSDSDLVLLDHLYTSVFEETLASNLPMVMVDYYKHPWTPKGMKLAVKRIEFVNAGFNENNKVCVDWNALKKAIEDAPSKRDNHEFYHYYYG